MGRITNEERRLIDEALEEGRVERQAATAEPERDPPAYPDRVHRPETSGRTPRAIPTVPQHIGVRGLLEWAFGTEFASFDADEIGASSGGQRQGVGMEYILEQRFQLGGVSIDTSPGKSSPAEDADVVASVVRAALPWYAAVWVADLARAGHEPYWMPDATPRLMPEEWHTNRHGKHGKTSDAAELGAHGWAPVSRRNRKGVIVRDEIRYTPCFWVPDARQIAAARRRYLDWYGYLLTLQVALSSVPLRSFVLIDDLPPMTPWRSSK